MTDTWGVGSLENTRYALQIPPPAFPKKIYGQTKEVVTNKFISSFLSYFNTESSSDHNILHVSNSQTFPQLKQAQDKTLSPPPTLPYTIFLRGNSGFSTGTALIALAKEVTWNLRYAENFH